MKSLFLWLSPPLAFKWRSDHVHRRDCHCSRPICERRAMSILSKQTFPAALDDRLCDAYGVTAEFLSDIVSETCRRFPCNGGNAKAARVERLIQSQAWTDAGLTLIDLELPLWQVRRLAYDEGEWYCALSRQRELPDWLDQSIETRHADLSLAILSAFFEAQRISTPSSRTSVPAVNRVASPLYEPVCSDNFA